MVRGMVTGVLPEGVTLAREDHDHRHAEGLGATLESVLGANRVDARAIAEGVVEEALLGRVLVPAEVEHRDVDVGGFTT